MKEAGVVYRHEGAAQVLPDDRGFAIVAQSVGLHHRVEGLARHELHAQADPPAVRLDPEDPHHVVVTNPGKRPALVQHSLAELLVVNLAMEDLDRDLELQIRIEGAVDAAVAALPDLFEELIAAPGVAERLGWRRGQPGGGMGGDGVRVRLHELAGLAMVVANLGDDPQPFQLVTALDRRRLAIERLPVDIEPIGHRLERLVQRVHRHGRPRAARPGRTTEPLASLLQVWRE